MPSMHATCPDMQFLWCQGSLATRAARRDLMPLTRRRRPISSLRPPKKATEGLTRTLPVRSIIVIKLLKSTQTRILVVDKLRERRIAYPAIVFALSPWQMPQRLPGEHVVLGTGGGRGGQHGCGQGEDGLHLGSVVLVVGGRPGTVGKMLLRWKTEKRTQDY